MLCTREYHLTLQYIAAYDRPGGKAEKYPQSAVSTRVAEANTVLQGIYGGLAREIRLAYLPYLSTAR